MLTKWSKNNDEGKRTRALKNFVGFEKMKEKGRVR